MTLHVGRNDPCPCGSFKDVLAEYHAERERWFRLHAEGVRGAMREWLGDHDIEPTTGPPERPAA